MKLRYTSALALTASALVLTGCGTTEPADAAAPAGEQITVTDARGTDVVLNGPADDVVGLEWNVVEHLVSLGVDPVGVADIDGYTAWVGNSAPLDGGEKDVGVRGEPSIESIAALSPDLVVATDGLPDAAITQLEEFVPVLVVRGADAEKGLDQMTEDLRLLATVTGTEAQADALLAELDAAFADARAELESAGQAGAEFTFMDAYAQGNQVSIRPFAEGSLVVSAAEEIGLVNAWTEPGDEQYGLGATDVEGLTALPDVHFLYIANGADDPFQNQLADNAVWTSLPFVQSGKVERLPDGIWMFGGVRSVIDFVNAAVAAVTD